MPLYGHDGEYFFVAIFGAKLISLAGFVTNAGNVFFAAVFFATHLLTEHYGKRDAQRGVWVSYAFQMLLVVSADLVIRLAPATAQGSAAMDNALTVIFGTAPRIVLASFSAYLFSLYTTIGIYDAVRTAFHGRMLWLRDTVANVVGQGVDSIIFFTVAFYGTLTSDMLLQTMAIGFVVKILIGVMGTPLLYVSYAMKPKELATT